MMANPVVGENKEGDNGRDEGVGGMAFHSKTVASLSPFNPALGAFGRARSPGRGEE